MRIYKTFTIEMRTHRAPLTIKLYNTFLLYTKRLICTVIIKKITVTSSFLCLTVFFGCFFEQLRTKITKIGTDAHYSPPFDYTKGVN